LFHFSRPAEKKSALDQQAPSVTRNLHKTKGDERGDVLIRGFWKHGTDCIIDIRCTDTDAKSVLSKDPAKVLETHEREKKSMYLGACLAQRRHFTPFVVSTDGLLGREAKTSSGGYLPFLLPNGTSLTLKCVAMSMLV
jgi:hypothetical protein